MTTAGEEWSCRMITGGKPIFFPYSSLCSSVYSQDGRYNIVILSHQVRVYYIATRQCIRSIDLELGDVVDCRINEWNTSQIYLFRSSGRVLIVNWKEKDKVSSISEVSIESSTPLLSVFAVTEDFFYFVMGKKDKKRFNSPHTRFIARVRKDGTDFKTITETRNVLKYSISTNSHKIAFLLNDSSVQLLDLSEIEDGVDIVQDDVEEDRAIVGDIIPYAHKSPITSIAISNNGVVALGSSTGVIQLLYGDPESKSSQSLLKWHIDQCTALCFTQDDSYLLSGGLEKVLVFWNLETTKTQFLPRLNGTISKIGLDPNRSDYYNLMLKTNSVVLDDPQEDSYEILAISAVDLVSRISINAIRPSFATNLRTSLLKTKKKLQKSNSRFDYAKLRHDYTSIFEVHPKTNALYFPQDAMIQAYDLVRNEQAFLQTAALILPIGKVRSERELLDPTISLISFTLDGEWMCTFEYVPSSGVDNLLSKDDIQYALKFWKYVESTSKSDSLNAGTLNNRGGFWELTTKILDPHGRSTSLVSLERAPMTYHQGLAFLTADSKGGMRIWRPRIPKEMYQSIKINGKSQQTAWTLRLSRPACAVMSDAVSTCWSDDGSLVLLSHENSIYAFESLSLEEIPDFQVPMLSGSRIRSLSLLDNNLIVLSKTRLCSFDLLSQKQTELLAEVNTTVGAKNLIAVNHAKKLICLAVNFYHFSGGELSLRSKILIFKPTEMKPVYEYIHSQGISSLRSFQDLFFFIDLDSRIGLLSLSLKGIDQDAFRSKIDLIDDMNKMLLDARTKAETNIAKDISNTNNDSISIPETDREERGAIKAIDVNGLQSIFDDADSVQIEALFERIVRATN